MRAFFSSLSSRGSRKRRRRNSPSGFPYRDALRDFERDDNEGLAPVFFVQKNSFKMSEAKPATLDPTRAPPVTKKRSKNKMCPPRMDVLNEISTPRASDLSEPGLLGGRNSFFGESLPPTLERDHDVKMSLSPAVCSSASSSASSSSFPIPPSSCLPRPQSSSVSSTPPSLPPSGSPMRIKPPGMFGMSLASIAQDIAEESEHDKVCKWLEQNRVQYDRRAIRKLIESYKAFRVITRECFVCELSTGTARGVLDTKRIGVDNPTLETMVFAYNQIHLNNAAKNKTLLEEIMLFLRLVIMTSRTQMAGRNSVALSLSRREDAQKFSGASR